MIRLWQIQIVMILSGLKVVVSVFGCRWLDAMIELIVTTRYMLYAFVNLTLPPPSTKHDIAIRNDCPPPTPAVTILMIDNGFPAAMNSIVCAVIKDHSNDQTISNGYFFVHRGCTIIRLECCWSVDNTNIRYPSRSQPL